MPEGASARNKVGEGESSQSCIFPVLEVGEAVSSQSCIFPVLEMGDETGHM